MFGKYGSKSELHSRRNSGQIKNEGCLPRNSAIPQHTYGGAEGERMFSSYSLTSLALDGVKWSVSLPGRTLAPGKGPPVPIVQEAGWAPEPVWTQRLEEKAFRLCQGWNLDRLVVQSVTRHYTDWATPTSPLGLMQNYNFPAVLCGRAKRDEVIEVWRKSHNEELIMCTPHQILSGWSSQGGWDGQDM
jgi:hypothetical protein